MCTKVCLKPLGALFAGMSDVALSFYSSEILLIVSVAFSKASITFLIVAIKPSMIILQERYALLAVVALWALSGIFALAFLCDLPRPWDFLLEGA